MEFLLAKPQSSVQQTMIPRESLELAQELGVGEFGSVLKGVWTSPDGERVIFFFLSKASKMRKGTLLSQ